MFDGNPCCWFRKVRWGTCSNGHDITTQTKQVECWNYRLHCNHVLFPCLIWIQCVVAHVIITSINWYVFIQDAPLHQVKCQWKVCLRYFLPYIIVECFFLSLQIILRIVIKLNFRAVCIEIWQFWLKMNLKWSSAKLRPCYHKSDVKQPCFTLKQYMLNSPNIIRWDGWYRAVTFIY